MKFQTSFWIKRDNKHKFVLPVSPDSFIVSVDHKNTVVNVVSLGDINLLGKSGLRSVSISSFFPGQDYEFSRNKSRLEPDEYVEKLDRWRKKNILVRFIVTQGGSHAFNMECSIESFSWGMKDGTQDIYYTLELKEYRTPSAKKRTQKEIKASTYKVKKGDTLGKIAKKHFGKNTAAYRDKIYKANAGKLKSKTKLPVGTKLKLPAATVTVWKTAGEKNESKVPGAFQSKGTGRAG